MTGGGGRARAPHGGSTGGNGTAPLDITLVLLIIFMVTAKLIVSHKAMSVDLPKAASGDEVQEIFSIVLAANGSIEVNGERLAQDDEVLERARTKGRPADLRAVIKAD